MQCISDWKEPWRVSWPFRKVLHALTSWQELELCIAAQSLRVRFQLPTGLIVHPMAGPQDLPVIGLDAGGIVRCRRCRTYINPFVTWTDGGRCAHIPLAL